MNMHEKRSAARAEARRRAEELVSKMTVEEKCSQLRYDALPIDRLGIPAYNWWNEGLHGVARAGVATIFPQAIAMAATFDSDLVKAEGECIAEEGRAKYYASIHEDDHDIYKGLTFWSPNVNIFRDPRWGRGHETLGEDPYLTSRLGLAFVLGLQGEEGNIKAAACAKHYAVHSGPEAVRHEFNAVANAKDMEETYLPAFETLVKEGDVESVMGAYNRTNGEVCCGSKTLLTDILRDKWGFKGHVVSDCWAIADFHTRHMVTSTPEESIALALGNGCDLNCGNTYLHLMSALEDGLITEEQITEAAVRLYTTRFLLGIENSVGEKTDVKEAGIKETGSSVVPAESTVLKSETDTDEHTTYGYGFVPYTVVEAPEHIALSRRAAEESVVLLQNKGGLLPLDADRIKTIGVIGPNADSRAALIGNYHGTSSEYVTVLQGIREAVGGRARILYSEGCDMFKDKTEPLSACVGDRISEALTVAGYSDVVVLVLGLDETLEGEEGDTGNSYASGDKNNLLLPESQRRLAEALAGMDKPVIVLNMTGSAMDLSFVSDHFDAVVQAWYPGSQGGRAIADILFGKISPSGKLPLTFYDSSYPLPDFTDYSMKGRTYKYIEGEAQYPFGYGLTYSDVFVERASVTQTGVSAADREHQAGVADDGEIYKAVINAEVYNSGKTDTDEVVQVYVEYPDSQDAPLHPVLGAFKRINIKAGQRAGVEIGISDPAFTVVTDDGRRIHPGDSYILHVGCSAPDSRSVSLTGHTPVEVKIAFGIS